MKVSHSKLELYNLCSKKYQYRYVYGYAPKFLTSQLFFGGIVGRIWQAFCLTKKDNLTQAEQEEVKLTHDWRKSIEQLMMSVRLNDTTVELSGARKEVWYNKGDFNRDLLDELDLAAIKEKAEHLSMFTAEGKVIQFEDLIEFYKSSKLDVVEHEYMNFHFWLCMINKAQILTQAYINEILPRITRVESVEHEISIKAQDGSGEALNDSITGFIDLVCYYKVDAENAERLGLTEGDEIRVIFDHKTSSRKYKSDKIKVDSQQLSIYEFGLPSKYVGYIVGVKDISVFKRGVNAGKINCKMQVLIDTLDIEKQEEFLTSAMDTVNMIKEEKFEKNFKSCEAYGHRCEFYGMCRENETDAYLFKRGRK
jgi:hypothetical protein